MFLLQAVNHGDVEVEVVGLVRFLVEPLLEILEAFGLLEQLGRTVQVKILGRLSRRLCLLGQ